MSRTKFVAVVLLLASAVVQANQCPRNGECPSDGEPQNGVSLLQTKLQTNVSEDVKKLARVEPDALEMMHKASSQDRHLATIRPPQPMKLSKVDITLTFQSAVPTFGPAGNYIALLHKYDNHAPLDLWRSDTLWNALKDYELFCSGPNRSHQVRMRILGGESDAHFHNHLVWHCDWPKEEANAGSYQVFFQDANGTEIGHLDTSYDPKLLKEYNTAACVTSVWPGTRGVLELAQWFEYNLLQGVDHFLVYTMTGTDERVIDIYRQYLNDGVATRVHLEIPDRLSGEYQAKGYSTQSWLANDCLYRMKNHAKWMFPTLDVDEYLRAPEVNEETNHGSSPWDRIISNWKDNTNNPNVRSISFGRYQFLRAQDRSAVQISSSMREEHITAICEKFVVNPALVNAVWIHWPTSWVAGSVGLNVPPQLAVVNHYRLTDSSAATVKDLALLAEVPAVTEAIEARFKSTWESLVTKFGAVQLMEMPMQEKEREENRLWRNTACRLDFSKIDQIEIVNPPLQAP